MFMYLALEHFPWNWMSDNAYFGFKDGYSIGCSICKSKEIEDGITLILASCFDSYEDGYCVFACKNKNFNGYYKTTWDIIEDMQYRGCSNYPNKFPNKLAGEIAFDNITCLDDFKKLKEDRYFYLYSQKRVSEN